MLDFWFTGFSGFLVYWFVVSLITHGFLLPGKLVYWFISLLSARPYYGKVSVETFMVMKQSKLTNNSCLKFVQDNLFQTTITKLIDH